MKSARLTIPFSVIIMSIALLFSSTYAEVLNVPDDYRTIQAAIGASEDGDTVLVKPGEYAENIDWRSKEISVIGNPKDPSDTIIDGTDSGSVIRISGMGEEAKLTGFTIRNGSAHTGGGIYVAGGCNGTFEDLIVIDNFAEGNGGGLEIGHLDGGEPILRNIIVQNNRSEAGVAGIHCIGTVHFEDVIILDNQCLGDSPSGLYLGYGQQTLTNVQVIGNSTDTYGAGIFMIDCEPILVNVLVAGNRAGGDGGGIRLWRANPTLTNVSVVDNDSERRNGGGLSVCRESHPVLRNCVFWNNQPNISVGVLGEATIDISYTDLQGGQDSLDIGEAEVIWGEGNIDEDPLFADPDEGDYHLTEDSPCIDTGDPDSDPDPDGTHTDMGAFYFHQRDIEVEPDTIEFIGVQTGTIDSSSVIIRNIGLTPLQIISISIDPEDAPFEVVGEAGEFELEPETDHQTWITFFPEDQAGYNAVLQIESDDPDEELVEIAITGTALGVENKDEKIPFEFGISSIHPNPFNSTTTIRYSLPFPIHASLVVYNTLGQRLRTVFDGYKHSGFHTVNLKADNLPSGLYFIRLEAPGQVSSQKVMLVR